MGSIEIIFTGRIQIIYNINKMEKIGSGGWLICIWDFIVSYHLSFDNNI